MTNVVISITNLGQNRLVGGHKARYQTSDIFLVDSIFTLHATSFYLITANVGF
ncbi:MAG: hypothetical protein K8R09_02230 [Desulfobacterales bacterium]|nr:hypothetical protein [Desulfobacterales bacterium]